MGEVEASTSDVHVIRNVPAPLATGGEPLQVLADVPIERDADDRLGFAAYADALAELLDHPATSTPLTVALTGPWGSGKTSLAQMVADRLRRWPVERGEPPHIVCWFNAWLHDDAPNPGAAFAAEVARVTARHRPWPRRILSPLPGRMLPAGERWRRGLLLLGLSLLPVILAVSWSVRHGHNDLSQALGLGQAAGLIAVTLAAVTLWTTLASTADTAGRFFRDPEGEAGRGTVSEVRGQLGELVAQATGGRRRLVIFVDDLERCLPGRAVEICEKAHQLFGHPDVAVVLIADVEALATAAAEKHSGEINYGRRYLEKLVQIRFSLPAAGPTAISALLQASEPVARPPSAAPAPRRRRILDRPGRWLAIVVGFSLFAVITEAFIQGHVSPKAYTAFDSTTGFIAIVLAGVTILSAVAEARRLITRLRSRDARARIDQKIEALATGQETGARDLAGEVRKATDAPAPLVENRVQRYLVDTSDARRQAEAELLRRPPALPRDSKRVLNQLRILLAVALRRDVFDTEPALTPAHLGRWVVLQHTWPDIARRLTHDPGLAADLESCTSPEALKTKADTADPRLLAFLHETPALSTAITPLTINFPAA